MCFLLCSFTHNEYHQPQFLNMNALQCHHNEYDGISNHWRIDCLLNCLFRHRSNKTSKLRVTDLCEGNSPLTCEFPAQKASNGENVSIWWRHHGQNFNGLHSLAYDNTISQAYHKTAVTPLLMYGSYCNPAPSHQYDIQELHSTRPLPDPKLIHQRHPVAFIWG